MAFEKKMKIFGKFLGKKCQVFGNFLTVKWQFSGGSGVYGPTIYSSLFKPKPLLNLVTIVESIYIFTVMILSCTLVLMTLIPN